MNVSRSSPSSSSGPSQRTRPPREQLEEADRLRQQGKLDRAEALCYPLASRYPGYAAALHTLGLVYLDKGSYERALDCLVRASMLDPASWMSLTALSLAYLRLGATEMAAQTLERALAIRPQDAAIFASLGEVHREQREHELAQRAYRQALTLDPNLQSAALGLALCLSALGQPADAASVLSAAYARGHRSLDLLHVMTTLPPNVVQLDLLGVRRWSIPPRSSFPNGWPDTRSASESKAFSERTANGDGSSNISISRSDRSVGLVLARVQLASTPPQSPTTLFASD
jgi:tetratricopeptide (TPR) repeat protein